MTDRPQLPLIARVQMNATAHSRGEALPYPEDGLSLIGALSYAGGQPAIEAPRYLWAEVSHTVEDYWSCLVCEQGGPISSVRDPAPQDHIKDTGHGVLATHVTVLVMEGIQA